MLDQHEGSKAMETFQDTVQSGLASSGFSSNKKSRADHRDLVRTALSLAQHEHAPSKIGWTWPVSAKACVISAFVAQAHSKKRANDQGKDKGKDKGSDGKRLKT
jgi:hypothetical protein